MEEIIQKSDIAEFFENMQSNDIPITEKMLWGFYFTDLDALLLEEVAQTLQKDGFLVYGVYIAEDEDGKELDYYCLRIEKEAEYTVDTLFEQSNSFYALEQKYELQSYDGFDVNFLNEEEAEEN